MIFLFYAVLAYVCLIVEFVFASNQQNSSLVLQKIKITIPSYGPTWQPIQTGRTFLGITRPPLLMDSKASIRPPMIISRPTISTKIPKITTNNTKMTTTRPTKAKTRPTITSATTRPTITSATTRPTITSATTRPTITTATTKPITNADRPTITTKRHTVTTNTSTMTRAIPTTIKIKPTMTSTTSTTTTSTTSATNLTIPTTEPPNPDQLNTCSIKTSSFVCPVSLEETNGTSSTTPSSRSSSIFNSTTESSVDNDSCDIKRPIGGACWSPSPAPSLRIFGGNTARQNQFPYQVGLTVTRANTDAVLCGGSIISANWILTAAHCLCSRSGHSAVSITVNYNSASWSQGQRAAVKGFVIHPDFERFYDPFYMKHDIALIELCSPLDFSLSGVKPICFLNERDEFTGDATASGWGLISKYSITDALQYVEMSLMAPFFCKLIYNSIFMDIENKYCSLSPMKDICLGDSGGPLVATPSTGCHVQLGIISSTTCPYSSTAGPSFFTKVSSYSQWICDTTEHCSN